MENIKVSFKDFKFIVDEKKQTVTCIMQYRINVPNAIKRVQSPFIDGDKLSHFTDKMFVARGVARVQDGDTFDVNVGKKVAQAKAENAAYKNAMKCLSPTYNKIVEAYVMLVKFNHKADNVFNHNVDYVRNF